VSSFKTQLFVYILLGISTSARCKGDVEWGKDNLTVTAPLDAAIVAFTFDFKNNGKLPVEFVSPIASCGCTSIKLDKSTYAPGESGVLKGTYNTRGRRGVNSVTITAKGAELDAGVRRPFSDTLNLRVVIPEVVKISHGITLWRMNSEVVAKTIRFEVNEARLLALKLAKIDNKNFEGKWKEIQAGRIYELKVLPASTAQSQQAMVTVEGMDETGKTLRFYVHLIIR
jgi:hypothetical protein